MRSARWAVLAGLLLLTNGWTLQKPPESAAGFRPVASISQIMKAIVVPSSDVLFGAAGDAPQDDEAWTTVQNNAVILMESGNLLMLPGRAKDQEGWSKASQELIEAGRKALQAAEAKNADDLAAAGDLIYNTCENCHATYYKNRQGNQ